MIFFLSGSLAQKAKYADKKIEALKKEVNNTIAQKAKMAQVIVDKVFSFAELGFQEEETSKYLTNVLKENGFSIEYGISDIPTAWWAKWGNGYSINSSIF